MFDSRPSVCNLCGGKVIYDKMVNVGIAPYQSGYCYYCTSCHAFVGTHRKHPKDALGILAKGDVRRMRIICHEELDRHWTTTSGKNRAYFRLSKELGIKSENCHFGYMDYDLLNRSLEIMHSWGNINFR